MKRILPYMSYIILILLSVFMVLFYNHPAFILMSVCLIFLPVLSRFVTKLAFERLNAMITFLPTNMTKGYHASLILQIQNPLRIPITHASCEITIRSEFYHHADRRKYLFPLSFHTEDALDFQLDIDKCGLYEATLNQVEVWDFLHMFRFKKNFDKLTQLLVFPNSQPFETVLSSVYAEGFDEFEESAKVGNVSANVTDIREYQPGDRLQKIHWKLSSKLDKLFVKENESTSTNQLYVLTELYSSMNSNSLDVSLESTWAICTALIRENLPFTLAVYSMTRQDFITEYIQTRQDLERAFIAIYYEKSYETQDLALNIFTKCGLNKGTVLHVSHKGVTDVTAT